MIEDPRTSNKLTRMEPRRDDWTTLIVPFINVVLSSSVSSECNERVFNRRSHIL